MDKWSYRCNFTRLAQQEGNKSKLPSAGKLKVPFQDTKPTAAARWIADTKAQPASSPPQLCWVSAKCSSTSVTHEISVMFVFGDILWLTCLDSYVSNVTVSSMQERNISHGRDVSSSRTMQVGCVIKGETEFCWSESLHFIFRVILSFCICLLALINSLCNVWSQIFACMTTDSWEKSP